MFHLTFSERIGKKTQTDKPFEGQVVLSGEDYDDMLMELSDPVRAAVEEAVTLVESLVEKEVKSV